MFFFLFNLKVLFSTSTSPMNFRNRSLKMKPCSKIQLELLLSVFSFPLLSYTYFVLNHPLINAVMQIQCYALRALQYYSTKIQCDHAAGGVYEEDMTSSEAIISQPTYERVKISPQKLKFYFKCDFLLHHLCAQCLRLISAE